MDSPRVRTSSAAVNTPDKPPPTGDRDVSVIIAAVLFGMGAWMSVNALYAHSSVFVDTQPEAQDISSFFVACQQAGNILFLLLLRVSTFLRLITPARTAPIIGAMLLISMASLLATAVSSSTTMVIAGGSRSVVLYAAMFLAGFASASSNALFFPVMAAYPRIYTVAYSFGLGLSSTIAGAAALIQDGPQSLYISPHAFFAFFTALAALSAAAFAYLALSQAARRVRAAGARASAEAAKAAGEAAAAATAAAAAVAAAGAAGASGAAGAVGAVDAIAAAADTAAAADGAGDDDGGDNAQDAYFRALEEGYGSSLDLPAPAAAATTASPAAATAAAGSGSGVDDVADPGVGGLTIKITGGGGPGFGLDDGSSSVSGLGSRSVSTLSKGDGFGHGSEGDARYHGFGVGAGASGSDDGGHSGHGGGGDNERVIHDDDDHNDGNNDDDNPATPLRMAEAPVQPLSLTQTPYSDSLSVTAGAGAGTGAGAGAGAGAGVNAGGVSGGASGSIGALGPAPRVSLAAAAGYVPPSAQNLTTSKSSLSRDHSYSRSHSGGVGGGLSGGFERGFSQASFVSFDNGLSQNRLTPTPAAATTTTAAAAAGGPAGAGGRGALLLLGPGRGKVGGHGSHTTHGYHAAAYGQRNQRPNALFDEESEASRGHVQALSSADSRGSAGAGTGTAAAAESEYLMPRLVCHFYVPFACLVLLAAMHFGLQPSFLPYAALSYHRGSRVYLIGNTISFFVDPLARLALGIPAVSRAFQRLSTSAGATAVVAVTVSLMVALAARSPFPWGWDHSTGGALPIVLTAVTSAVYSATFTALFLRFYGAAETAAAAIGAGKDEAFPVAIPPAPASAAAVEAVRAGTFQAAGVSVQIGATTGAIIAFLVVVVFKMIPDPIFR